MQSNLKSKKILFITHTYETFIKESIEEVAKYFLEVNVIVRYKPIIEFFKFLNNSELNLQLKENSIKLQNLPENVKVFRSDIFYIPGRIFYRKIGDIHLKEVEKVITKNKIQFDIIHGHFGWSAGYVSAKLSEKYKVPSVVTFHGEDAYELPFLDLKWTKLISEVCKSANSVLTVSERNRKCLLELINRRIDIIPNGYNSKKFIFQKENSIDFIPENKKVFLNVANLNSYKGQEYLLKAISIINDIRNDVFLVIVGDGHLKNELLDLKSKLKLDNIFFTGWLEHSEIPKFMNRADYFVLSSVNEGNPTVLFEALGSGLPFIGTNVGGITDIIVEGQNGFLVNPRDEVSLAKIMMEAIDHPWNRAEIKNNSNRYTWENIIKKTTEVYSEYF
jgi:glycosyltransferase involved in cell wall biosynthesis